VASVSVTAGTLALEGAALALVLGSATGEVDAEDADDGVGSGAGFFEHATTSTLGSIRRNVMVKKA
jgi:hypothetical protein